MNLPPVVLPSEQSVAKNYYETMGKISTLCFTHYSPATRSYHSFAIRTRKCIFGDALALYNDIPVKNVILWFPTTVKPFSYHMRHQLSARDRIQAKAMLLAMTKYSNRYRPLPAEIIWLILSFGFKVHSNDTPIGGEQIQLLEDNVWRMQFLEPVEIAKVIFH